MVEVVEMFHTKNIKRVELWEKARFLLVNIFDDKISDSMEEPEEEALDIRDIIKVAELLGRSDSKIISTDASLPRLLT
jgi:hypothetical protein